MASDLPAGLEHVLEVYRLVRQSHFDRLPAIREVARKRRVDFQTVSSACTRSLGINTEEFEEFLDRRNSASFREHLIRRFPDYQSGFLGTVYFIRVSIGAGISGERVIY